MYQTFLIFYSTMLNKRALIISESTVYVDKNGDFVSRGGGEAYIHTLATSLVSLGVETEVFGIREYADQSREETIDGVLYKRFPVYSRSSFKLFLYLRSAISEAIEFDFVFLSQFTPHLILPFLHQKKIAIIYDIYCENSISFWMKNYGFFRGVIGIIVERLQLFFDGRYADTIFTISQSSKKKIIHLIGTTSEKKIVVSPSPIDTHMYIADQPKGYYLLYVGRFVDYKNPSHVLYVLKNVLNVYPDFKAIFVVPRAEKDCMDEFYRLVHEMRIGEHVEVKKSVSTEELRRLYASAKVLVQPSYVEGQGIVVLESLASGTPVVAYNLEAYQGMLLDGDNSVLVEKGNMEALADGCLNILTNYASFQKHCKVTLEEFSPGMFRDRLEKLLER